MLLLLVNDDGEVMDVQAHTNPTHNAVYVDSALYGLAWEGFYKRSKASINVFNWSVDRNHSFYSLLAAHIWPVVLDSPIPSIPYTYPSPICQCDIKQLMSYGHDTSCVDHPANSRVRG